MVGGGRAGGGYQEIQEQEQEVRAQASGAISTASKQAGGAISTASKQASGAISTASRQAGGAISTAASKASRHQLLTVQMHKPHSPMQPLPRPGLISNAVWKYLREASCVKTDLFTHPHLIQS